MLKQHTSDQSWCPPGPVLKVQCPGETATTVTISTVARTRTTRRAMDPELDLSMKDIRYVKGFLTCVQKTKFSLEIIDVLK